MTGLYTPTLNTFAAGVCSMAAVMNAVAGDAWWTLISAVFAGLNVYFASRTTVRIAPPKDRP